MKNQSLVRPILLTRAIAAASILLIAAACSVSGSASAPGDTALGNPDGEPGAPQPLPKAIDAVVYRGNNAPSIDDMNTVNVSDLSQASSVSWLKVKGPASERLMSLGFSVMTMGTNCDFRNIKTEKAWVVFKSTGAIDHETPIDDFNSGVFDFNPAESALMRVTVKGRFSGCDAVGVSFAIQPAPKDVGSAILTAGYYSVSSSAIGEIRIEPVGQNLKAIYTLSAAGAKEQTVALSCYKAHCLGMDAEKNTLYLSVNSEKGGNLRFLVAAGQALFDSSLGYQHGLSPRPVDPNQSLLYSLAGSWLGSMQADTSAPLKLTMTVSTYTSSTGTSLDFVIKDAYGSYPLGHPHVTILPNGQINEYCVFNDRPVGSYDFKRVMQFMTLDNSCQSSPNRFVRFEMNNDGRVQVTIATGSRTYSGLFTAW